MTKLLQEVSSIRNFVSRMAAYDDLFERTRDAVILLDYEIFSVLDLNSAGLQILGEAKNEMVGKVITDWLGDGQRDEFLKLLNDAKVAYYAKSKILLWKTRFGRAVAMEVTVCTLRLANDMQVLQVIARDMSNEIELRRKTAQYLKQLQEANTRLETLSQQDELTGLSNFRHFQKLLQVEHARAKNEKRQYSVVFFDVDNFKAYNDRNGHLAGDELLKQLGALIRANSRDADYPARYGGEEFAILSVGATRDIATNIANRIKTVVEQHPFPFRELQPLGKVSISIGVANFPQDGQEATQVLNAADDAAYQSKKAGRNRVTLAMKKAA